MIPEADDKSHRITHRGAHQQGSGAVPLLSRQSRKEGGAARTMSTCKCHSGGGGNADGFQGQGRPGGEERKGVRSGSPGCAGAGKVAGMGGRAVGSPEGWGKGCEKGVGLRGE